MWEKGSENKSMKEKEKKKKKENQNENTWIFGREGKTKPIQ